MTETSGRRRADAIANRRAILDAATNVLGESPQATLADIAAAANLSRRTIYLHFTSRDELILAAARDIGEHITARATATPDTGQPLLDLAQFVHANGSAVAKLRRLAGFTTVAGARQELSAATTTARERITALLQRAQECGDLDTRIPPRAGMHIIAAMQWGLFEAVSNNDLSPDEAAATAVRSVLGAVGAHPTTTEKILNQIESAANPQSANTAAPTGQADNARRKPTT